VKDERGDLVADCNSILAGWRNHFCQLLNVHGVSDIGQKEIHTAEPLVPEPSAFEVELAIEKLKSHKSPVLIKSQQSSLKQGVEKFAMRSIKFSILFGIRRNCLSGCSQSLHLSIRRGIKQTVVITEAYHFCQLRTKCYPTSCCQG